MLGISQPNVGDKAGYYSRQESQLLGLPSSYQHVECASSTAPYRGSEKHRHDSDDNQSMKKDFKSYEEMLQAQEMQREKQAAAWLEENMRALHIEIPHGVEIKPMSSSYAGAAQARSAPMPQFPVLRASRRPSSSLTRSGSWEPPPILTSLNGDLSGIPALQPRRVAPWHMPEPRPLPLSGLITSKSKENSRAKEASSAPQKYKAPDWLVRTKLSTPATKPGSASERSSQPETTTARQSEKDDQELKDIVIGWDRELLGI